MGKKVIVVMGSGISSLGKGICAASIAKLLQDQGYNVCNKKVDPYLQNADTLSPLQHGEVYVTDDGSTIDQDFGSYYRFASQKLTKNESITSSGMYAEMLQREKEGEFLGQTVQLTPHYTNYINNKILNVNNDTDIIIEEIGGIITEPEANVFLEAARQLKRLIGKENVCYVLLTYIPYIHPTNELKTKLCQTGVKELRSFGIEPDFIICRTEKKLPQDTKKKISIMCDVEESAVIEGIDVSNIYQVPIKFKKQDLDKKICNFFNMDYKENNLKDWKKLLNNIDNPTNEKTIAIVGKYISNPDAYASIKESLKIAGAHLNTKINIKWIDSEEIEEYRESIYNNAEIGVALEPYGDKFFSNADGVVVAGGFGKRGVEGKILAAKWCRESKMPYLGICLGMQVAAIEFARYGLGYLDATSEEFDIDKLSNNHVIHLMENQKNLINMSETMRLGNYKCSIEKDSITHTLYNSDLIERRHRHRYEFNSIYKEEFINHGMKIVGTNPDNNLVEILEFENHPFYIGVQYHPEFNSKFTEPEELFTGLITAALKEK